MNWSRRSPRRSPSRFSMSSNAGDGRANRSRSASAPGTGWRIRRLKIEASLRRWRRFSVRYARERLWVERWLHMIDRALTKQPEAASAIVQTATMVQGYGAAYRQGLADWHAIIDGLAKPTFDGVLPLRIWPAPWRRPARLPCPIRGRPRSSAPSRRSGRGRWPAGQTRRRGDRRAQSVGTLDAQPATSRALRRLDASPPCRHGRRAASGSRAACRARRARIHSRA